MQLAEFKGLAYQAVETELQQKHSEVQELQTKLNQLKTHQEDEKKPTRLIEALYKQVL